MRSACFRTGCILGMFPSNWLAAVRKQASRIATPRLVLAGAFAFQKKPVCWSCVDFVVLRLRAAFELLRRYDSTSLREISQRPNTFRALSREQANSS